TDIPGWFQWRSAQEEAALRFPDGSRFLEVGNFLGRSLCSLGDVVQRSGKRITVIGVDTCRGSGVEGVRGKDYHGTAVEEGGGAGNEVGPEARPWSTSQWRWVARPV